MKTIVEGVNTMGELIKGVQEKAQPEVQTQAEPSPSSKVQPAYRQQLKQLDINDFLQKSDFQAFRLLAFNWSLIVLAFVIPAIWLNPLNICISLLVLANRQLGLSILMHECAHYSLFKTRPLNNWLGQVFFAAPILANVSGYRSYHLKHHREAGTTDDPDYPNYKDYPVSKMSLLRKTARDFSGLTGIKMIYAMLLMNAGILSYDLSYQGRKNDQQLSKLSIVKNLLKNLCLPFTIQLAMFSVLYVSGHAWLYSLWWISYLTVYMFLLRIRNAAEHANVPDLLDKDPRLHARTTYAIWWERMTFAPNFVNFHLEHHWQANVPCYHLKAFHYYIKSKGLLADVEVSTGYFDVVKRMLGNVNSVPVN